MSTNTGEHNDIPRNQVYAIEIGHGHDLHGQDATVACARACADAMARNSYPGLSRMLPEGDLGRMRVHVLLGVPSDMTSQVRVADIKQVFPHGTVQVDVVAGGLAASSGVNMPEAGDRPTDDRMLIVDAVITVGS